MFRDLIIELLIIWQFRCFVKCLKNLIFLFGCGTSLMGAKLLLFLLLFFVFSEGDNVYAHHTLGGKGAFWRACGLAVLLSRWRCSLGTCALVGEFPRAWPAFAYWPWTWLHYKSTPNQCCQLLLFQGSLRNSPGWGWIIHDGSVDPTSRVARV